jgi:hypothetical protein
MSEMPLYQSHKRVRALRISRVDGEVVYFAEDHPPMNAKPNMFARYTPVPGDYWVKYEDGYESISPCEAFEEGYTRV